MPTVVCWQLDCLFNADGQCRAERIEYDPADGCLTVEPRLESTDADDEEEDWELSELRALLE